MARLAGEGGTAAPRSCAREKPRSGGLGEEKILTSGGRGPFPMVSPRIGPGNPCLVGFQMDME